MFGVNKKSNLNIILLHSFKTDSRLEIQQLFHVLKTMIQQFILFKFSLLSVRLQLEQEYYFDCNLK